MVLTIHLVNLNELVHMQVQPLLYFYRTSKLQRIGYHGKRIHFVKLKCLKNAHYELGGHIV